MNIQWVIFDLNGTVFDPRPISQHLPEPLNTEATALALLHETVFQGMTDTLVGRYRPFLDYLAAAVERQLVLAGHDPVAGVEKAVVAAGQLPAFPEAAQAMQALVDAGLRIATITNSSSAVADRSLTAAGLRDRFDVVVGSDTCQAYKPASIVYENGLRRIGAKPNEACMVAAHGWDLLGAHHAGMHTVWISRGEQVPLTTLPSFDVIAPDLLAAAHAIVASR